MHIQALRGLLLAGILIIYAPVAQAAQYAALVMDARTGEVLHSRNADTRLHPASLTKMMTLYVVFDEVRRGRLSMDQKVRISRNAASKPPSKLGLRAGQTIEIKYLVRAAAVKSANDAATALAEAVSGSEAAFARRMTEMARAMGMRNTTFRNAHGLTQRGHLSTARDMAILGRQLFYDFPQYYNLFSRRSTSAKLKTVYNTNRRLLDAYRGADGIKTGYTRAAGFNLVASAERGNKRVIVSMFGGTSSAARNQRVAELMDLGLGRMPRRARIARPARPHLGGEAVQVARASTQLRQSFAPMPRPGRAAPVAVAEAEVAAIAAEVTRAITDDEMAKLAAEAQTAPTRPELMVRPKPRPGSLTVAAVAPAKPKAAPPAAAAKPDAGSWVLQIGGKHNRSNAERLLLTTALQEMEALEGSKRDLQPTGEPGWYRARFVGLSEAAAQAACARLAARQTPCQVIGVGG